MRETLGPPMFATHTAPGETAIPTGFGPTWIVAATALVRGSIRETVFREGWVNHTAPLPTANSGRSGVSPSDSTLMRATIAFRFGSIRISVESASLIAQTAPSPTASPPPPNGTAILATTSPPRGRTRRLPDVTTGRARGEPATLGLMRVSVFEA